MKKILILGSIVWIGFQATFTLLAQNLPPSAVGQKSAYLLPIERNIDIVALRHTHLALAQAKQASVVVLYLHTAYIDSEYAQDIAQKIRQSAKKVWLVVHTNSSKEISPISIASERTIFIKDKTELLPMLAEQGLKLSETNTFVPDSAEQLSEFLLNFWVSGLLLLIVAVGLVYQVKLPHIIFPTIISIIAAIAYFIPYYQYGLAADWELICFLVGLGLLALELIAVPGFGITGVAGILTMILSLILMQLRNEGLDFSAVHQQDLTHALNMLAIGLVGSIVFLSVVLPRLLKSPRFRKLALQKTLQKTEGYVIPHVEEHLLDKQGITLTAMRPIGKVKIEGKVYQATTQGNFLEAQTPVVVIEQEGLDIVVKKI